MLTYEYSENLPVITFRANAVFNTLALAGLFFKK